MRLTNFLLILASTVAAAPTVLSHPYFVYESDETSVDPSVVTDVECGDPDVNIAFHDQNVAELRICGGTYGSTAICGGNSVEAEESSGTAKITLIAQRGATINISKGRWETCVRAARAICPTGELAATCVGGASSGKSFDFFLEGT